ncbi:CotO family spore coat protein [Bacillus paramycoides]|uniref:CotO family spore coat protein n=1 Tax=Bacillus paramycoides TaxID=2026194 RepID=A0ABU6MRL1_9BACI|nr:CotO family spore coat protein [Bacillus paramycoides]
MEVGGTSVKNKNKSSTVGKPLLYIAQVNLELDTPKIKRILLTNFKNDGRREQSDRDQSIVSSAVEEVIEQERQEQAQVRTVPHNKSFKNMRNEEKINFLLNRPHYIPKVRCRIKTVTISYVGSIISYQNGVLSIMPSNSMRDIKLPIKEIKSIDMAGL